MHWLLGECTGIRSLPGRQGVICSWVLFFVVIGHVSSKGRPRSQVDRGAIHGHSRQQNPLTIGQRKRHHSVILEKRPQQFDTVENIAPKYDVAINGGWSDWQPWSDCQTSCGSGFRVRERWCNRPPPSDGGKDCEGASNEKEPCKVKIHCPVNGGWGTWTQWHCSVTCGHGTASRTRLCDSPPAIYGGVCVGNATDIRDTPCNVFTCPPTRKVSNETLSILQNTTRDFHVREHIIPEGTQISKILCGTKQLLDNLLWELKTDFRKAITWTRNGEPWKEDKSRIDKMTTALDFKRAAANDTGFYSCELDLLGGGRKYLKAFSLIVTSNKTNLDVEAGQPFEMNCNAMVLGTIYPNARLSWYFNGTLYKSFNDTPAILANTLKCQFATLNMSGPWECRTYELAIKEIEETRKRKSMLGRLKDKVFKSKAEEEEDRKEEEAKKKKQGPVILRPLFKHVSTPAPPPEIVTGRIWVTNKLIVRVNPPKSIADMIRTPQFMGLCVGVAVLAVAVTVGLLKDKVSDMINRAQGNLEKMDKNKEQDDPLAEIGDPAGAPPQQRPNGDEDDIIFRRDDVKTAESKPIQS